jgi:hypothetical protein
LAIGLGSYVKHPVESRFQGILRDEMAEQVITDYCKVNKPYGALSTTLEADWHLFSIPPLATPTILL